MELDQAVKQFKSAVSGLDASHLEGQEEAFRKCMTFFVGVEKSQKFNNRRGSYGLKHVVESPSNDTYNGYVYEGTLILAALASGFKIKQAKSLRAAFNISESSLKKRIKEFASTSRKR